MVYVQPTNQVDVDEPAPLLEGRIQEDVTTSYPVLLISLPCTLVSAHAWPTSTRFWVPRAAINVVCPERAFERDGMETQAT